MEQRALMLSARFVLFNYTLIDIQQKKSNTAQLNKIKSNQVYFYISLSHIYLSIYTKHLGLHSYEKMAFSIFRPLTWKEQLPLMGQNEEASRRGTDRGQFSQDTQGCDECCTYKRDQHYSLQWSTISSTVLQIMSIKWSLTHPVMNLDQASRSSWSSWKLGS